MPSSQSASSEQGWPGKQCPVLSSQLPESHSASLVQGSMHKPLGPGSQIRSPQSSSLLQRGWQKPFSAPLEALHSSVSRPRQAVSSSAEQPRKHSPLSGNSGRQTAPGSQLVVSSQLALQ
jgi:hypothetical protein